MAVIFAFNAVFWAADKDFLQQEYVVNGKSMARIAGELGCARSTVGKYLLEHGLPLREQPLPKHRAGQLAYGQKLLNGQVIPHLGELKVIDELKKMRGEGATYTHLVKWLNENGLKTKNGRSKWERPTVQKILNRTFPILNASYQGGGSLPIS